MRELAEMSEITQGMVADALAAYVSRNPGTARMVCLTDDKVDDLRHSMYRILVTHTLSNKTTVEKQVKRSIKTGVSFSTL
jgi:phosphate uptake regulator